MYTLPKLPYQFDALEPVIDEKTMEIHYTKHHQAYIDKLNTAIEAYDDLSAETIEDLMRNIDQVPIEISEAVKNNGGGHANHSLFWTVLAPTSHKSKPGAELSSAIDQDLGGMDKLKTEFSGAALSRFGSGWAWLVVEDGKLHVCSTPNQDTPLMRGNTPILGLDVWEHAYYLKYQNRRQEYIENWWSLINWDEVNRRYTMAMSA